MKWIALTSLVLLLTACHCCRRDIVDYRPMRLTPALIATPVYGPTPVYDPVTVIDEQPIDVTTTTIDYY